MAGPDVNVHDFESVGNKIIEDIIVKSAFTYKFKRKDIAQTLRIISAVKIAPDHTIDPAFSSSVSLWYVSRSGDLSLEEVFTYELSPYPPALFETRPRTFFEKQTNLSLLRQFETMLRTYQVRL